MKKLAMLLSGATIAGIASADSIFDVDEMVCAAGQVQICLENDTCYESSAAELAIPDIVVIDTKARKISTTRSSGETRMVSGNIAGTIVRSLSEIIVSI